MAVQIGAKPDSGFDDPIGMLKDCHRRIEHFLHILCVVADRGEGRALSDEERAAVQSALAYFRSGGRRHTADEEESLFPRLERGDGADQFEDIAGLQDDHRHADTLHVAVDQLYSFWIATGRLQKKDELQLSSATKQLKQLYADHIQVEETIVFPRASKLLDKGTIAAIGEEFRARRK
ncbi:MAG: hemerythrin domain-containing protein [Acidobacteriota bacterium]|nr:hemerythrin domain-containing protein [Acidobacteriota bacterium]